MLFEFFILTMAPSPISDAAAAAVVVVVVVVVVRVDHKDLLSLKSSTPTRSQGFHSAGSHDVQRPRDNYLFGH